AFVLSQDQTLVLDPADFFPLNSSEPLGSSDVFDSFELTVVLHPDPSGCLILYRFQDPRALISAPQGASLERLCILIEERLFVNHVSAFFLKLFWFFCLVKTKRAVF
ncbi:MAG: hypothetical protein IKP22_15440, partial [Clostridia bacterium]|nr:hypothetical protein [Clostridia bacterium]